MIQKSSDRWCVARMPSAKPHAAVASAISSASTASVHSRMLHRLCRCRKPLLRLRIERLRVLPQVQQLRVWAPLAEKKV